MKKALGLEAVSDQWWSHISAVEDFFEGQDESFYMYTTGIQALQHRWKKCADRRVTTCMLKNNQHLVKFNHCIS